MYLCLRDITILRSGRPSDVVANVLDCDFKVTEFKLQSRDRTHFWTKYLGKSMKPLIQLSQVK